MNATQAKRIEIMEFLTSQGVEPQKKTLDGNRAIYLSPIRQENNASFHVDVNNNVWYDHGAGIGGNIIDLVMCLENVDFKEALKILGKKRQDYTFSFQQQSAIQLSKQTTLELIEVKQITHPALTGYLENRRISMDLAKKFTKEIHYRVNGKSKKYFAIGFVNEKGGYELRNKYFKGSSSPKYYSFIRGNVSDKLDVYEGFIDFLSALVLENKLFPNHDSLILNSTSNLGKANDTILKYPELYLFLDNDFTGKQAARQLETIHPNVNDLSISLYPNCEDLNDFLVSRKNIPSQKVLTEN